MDKLIKQLKREFKKNPKKFFMLGALCLVCAWFWGPLLFPSDEKKSTKPKAAATAMTVSPSTTASAAGPTAWRWQDLDSAFKRDPRMAVAPLGAMSRNPFVVATEAFDADAAMDELLEEVAADIEREKIAVPSGPSSLDAVPLFLSSTLVGQRSRQAVINGRTFVEGAAIGTAQGKTLVLRSVEPRRAVVEWDGRLRELKIFRPGESDDKTGHEQKLGAASQKYIGL